ncbi:hypothetical protein MMC28_009028 [Mycoblastus sanguinarius]|nr:hypothetical protein [Mycoblastus sanguinarius]
MAPSLNNDRMFEFNGTAADSREGREPNGRVADHCNMQQLGRRPYTTMVHHQRALTEDVKRPSLVDIRSRSNTSTSSSPLEVTNTKQITSFDRSNPANSTDRRSSSGSTHTRGDSSSSLGKALLSKGSRFLRRQNSKQDQDLTSLRTLDWLEESERGRGDHVQETPHRRNPRHSRIRSDDVAPRWNISEPFNFHHLTHTMPHHVQRLDDASINDLVSEFSAIRASQRPRRELRGIKAEDIPRRSFAREASGSANSSPPRTAYADSPSLSPEHTQHPLPTVPHSPATPDRSLHPVASAEIFTQPSAIYYTAQSSPTTPPPRSSSRNHSTDFFSFHQDNPIDTSEYDISSEGPESLDYPIATWNDGVYDFEVPHAVTTPDDTAHTIRPLPFSMVRTELTGVPEEDETLEGKRNSTTTLIRRPSTPNSNLRHAKSFPGIKLSPHRWSGALPPALESDIDSPTKAPKKSVQSVAPCMEHLEDVPVRPHLIRRISRGIDDSWEDLIDYCYEHEAEADCNFDWDSVSTRDEETNALDNATSGPTEVAGPNDQPLRKQNEDDVFVSPKQNSAARQRSSSNYSSPPTLLPLQTYLPELDPPSANSVESSFSSIPEAVTPSQSSEAAIPTRFPGASTKEWPVLATSPPFLMPVDLASQAVQDDLYQQILTGDFASEHQFSFNVGLTEGSIIDESPRSSRSPISKSSSQESFWYSQAGAAVRRHRNAGSVGSLPELVPSKGSREKVDPVVDRLADHNQTSSVIDFTGDGQQISQGQRKRSSSLAKDVAQKSMLSKVMTSEDQQEVPLSLKPVFRERAYSDVAAPIPDMPVPPLPPSTFARRMRSTSSTSNITNPSPRASRVSYSLFPPNTTKQTSPL